MSPESTLMRIHQAARKEFRERGFHGASLRSIVKSLGHDHRRFLRLL